MTQLLVIKPSMISICTHCSKSSITIVIFTLSLVILKSHQPVSIISFKRLCICFSNKKRQYISDSIKTVSTELEVYLKTGRYSLFIYGQ